MKNNHSTNGLLVYPAMLSIWLAVSCAAFFYADIKTAMAGTLIIAALAASSLALQSGVLVLSINILTIIVYGVMIYIIYGLTPAGLLTWITFSTATIGTGFLAWKTSGQFSAINKQISRDRILIEDLRVKDSKTGLTRFHFARKTLSTEVARSLRFGKKLTIVLIKIKDWDELAQNMGLENRDRLLSDICEVLFNHSRNIDTIFINMDKIGVILPETDPAGASVFAGRLFDQVFKRCKVELRMGIAGFPEDSIIDEDLLTKCENALKAAIETNQQKVLFTELVPQNKQTDPESEPLKLSDNQKKQHAPKERSNQRIIHFRGVKSLTEIETLQHYLEKIRELKEIRIADFEDDLVSFTFVTENKKVAELLLTKLEIPNITIEETTDAIFIKLDSGSA